MVADQQRADPSRLLALSEEFHRRLPAAAIARRRSAHLCRRARALRQRIRLRRLQSQSRSVGRQLERSAADRQVVVSALREDGRTRRARHDPCQRVVQSELPHHRRALHQRRHHRLHAAHHVDLFKDFPTLKFIIPHGGGAVPYHWGRYRGLAQDMKRPPLEELLLKNVYFDTCVYHLPGIELLTKVIPVDNILFASEMVGAVKGIDPNNNHYYDDTKFYIDALPLSDEGRRKIFETNARRVYRRDRTAPFMRRG